MIIHYNIKVIGKVQGVRFRASTQRNAHELGITGFVRNEPDGSVYIEAEGEENSLKQLVEWCHQGPKGAKVDKAVVENDVIKNFEIFEIRH